MAFIVQGDNEDPLILTLSTPAGVTDLTGATWTAQRKDPKGVTSSFDLVLADIPTAGKLMHEWTAVETAALVHGTHQVTIAVTFASGAIISWPSITGACTFEVRKRLA